jgi:hypothetical protein
LGSAIEAGGIMATKSALIDPAARGSGYAQADELALASAGGNENAEPAIKYVIGPDGRRLTLAALPLPHQTLGDPPQGGSRHCSARWAADPGRGL